VVEIEEKINKVWNIRQRDDETILAYTYRYESLVVSALELEAEINDSRMQEIVIDNTLVKADAEVEKIE
ncbi:8227_t:CDS:2, partial [Racocetra persica]